MISGPTALVVATLAPPAWATLRIGVLHNPRSGANRKAPTAPRRVCAAHPQVPCCKVTDPAGVFDALDALARQGVNTLAISGGDGTIQAILSVLFSSTSPFRQLPLLAVLRAGTTNMIAGDVGLRGHPGNALSALITHAARGGEGLKIVRRPILRIDTGPERPPICGAFFGAAAIVQGVEYCTRKIHRVGLRGELGPGITVLRFMFAMARRDQTVVPPIRLGVSLDGAPSERIDCWIVQVTTLERLFLGVRPFWGSEAAPLHYTSVHARPRYWLRAFPALLRGHGRRLTRANGYVSHNVHELELEIDSPFVVDGEIFAPTPGQPLRITSAGVAGFVRLVA